MASVEKFRMISAKALTADFTTEGFALEASMDEICFWLLATGQHADTTLDVKVQHSPDKTNWKDLVSFTQQTDTGGSELKGITLPIMGFIRTVVALTGTTKAATVTVDLLFSRKG
jgi:hypothetical protein